MHVNSSIFLPGKSHSHSQGSNPHTYTPISASGSGCFPWGGQRSMVRVWPWESRARRTWNTDGPQRRPSLSAEPWTGSSGTGCPVGPGTWRSCSPSSGGRRGFAPRQRLCLRCLCPPGRALSGSLRTGGFPLGDTHSSLGARSGQLTAWGRRVSWPPASSQPCLRADNRACRAQVQCTELSIFPIWHSVPMKH